MNILLHLRIVSIYSSERRYFMGTSYDSKAIANYFIDKGDITPMKLQKLVYFAHGWHLGLSDNALIDEDVQAWNYGPVIESLYHEFKMYGNNPINSRAQNLEVKGPKLCISFPEIPVEDSQTRNFLDKIWEVYGKYTGAELANLTHKDGTPWKNIYDRCGGQIPKRTIIPNEDIKAYFKTKAAV